MRLWRLCRPPPGRIQLVGMGGGIVGFVPAPRLPLQGPGVLDDPAWLADACDFLDGLWAKREAGRGG